ncbi:MAG: hypothetical protein V3S69_08045, partial [Dehalococcoidales bacterium]
ENMLFRAMITESTMDDLLRKMPSSEIKGAALSDYGGGSGKLPMIMADVSQDRLYRLVQDVQASIVNEYSTLLSLDRLIVQSHKRTGETELGTAQAEICYWSYKDEVLA